MVPESADSSASLAPSVKWSMYAGAYAFLCGALLLLPLGFVANALVMILPLPNVATAVVVPGSSALVGAAVWWVVVERREAYTYLFGGLVGLVTVLATVLFWMVVIAVVWGLWSLQIAGTGLVILFVLAVATPVGVVAGMPIMYARRRLGTAPRSRESSIGS